MLRTALELRDVVEERLAGRKLIVVSNREPYVHTYAGDRIVCQTPAGGLVAALDPVMRACGGTWVAHGSGDADRAVVDANDRVLVPPVVESPGDAAVVADRYRLRRVWLSKSEEEGYYDGFANQALWPLCHHVFVRPRFERAHWRAYRAVNARFAEAVLEEVGSEPAVVFVQDYHFALLPRLLKQARPDLVVGQFWHIPWPGWDSFRVCPWSREVLDGLLGNDLLGFHTLHDCENFLDAAERGLLTPVDQDAGTVRGSTGSTLVRPFPIGVDAQEIAEQASSPAVAAEARRLRDKLGLSGQLVGVGVDRVDYTKGIPERIAAIDRLLDVHPEYRGRFTFLQLGPVSRGRIGAYRQLGFELASLVDQVNRKHGSGDWVPIRVLTANHPRDRILAYFQLADLCVVSSLHDGMNLVAKEFVAARSDGQAALVLSEFTGSAAELADAIQVNPYDVDGFADALRLALEMPTEEKATRMARMRRMVHSNSVFDWAAGLLAELATFAPAPRPERRGAAIVAA